MPDYPYVLNNGKIAELLERIAAAARPERFSQEFLERIGLTSSNDRAFVPLLRRLGFVSESGVPTPAYDDLRDPAKRSGVLAQHIRELYSDLFNVNTSIQTASDADIRAAVARVTGKDEATSGRIANTFKALVQQARFGSEPERRPTEPSVLPPERVPERVPERAPEPEASERRGRSPQFHYNIQIVLPATTEVAVYNAIFRSLRENLDF